MFTAVFFLLLLLIVPTDARRMKESGAAGSLASLVKAAETNKSGPSPGVGHKHGESKAMMRRAAAVLGQVKDSGPSPGQGH
ncbi:unnamed protein product [Linum trigynum]